MIIFYFFKTRLYCLSLNSELRMSAIYVFGEILDQVTVILAPILPHLTEEIEMYHPWHSGIELLIDS